MKKKIYLKERMVSLLVLIVVSAGIAVIRDKKEVRND